ncbi:class I SAM-dependent methyltransferase [Selenomonadales bacterium OttesenSCG-928-I06]|nr:class I SAM-dependent methyltransferase [Selenomonadales bacterium OttesenSCG-928-I06]
MSKIEMFNKMAANPENKPKEIISVLDFKNGDNVLEIGVGGGYYANMIAQIIGPAGTYYGFEINEEFIDNLKQVNLASKYKNIKPIKITENSIPKLDKKMDLVFTRNSYHHLENRVEYFSNLKPLLNNDAKIVIIDFNKNHLTIKPDGHFVKKEVIVEEMTEAGYVLKTDYEILPFQSFLVFKQTNN